MEPTTALAETGGLDEADKILTDAATGAGPEDDVQALRQLQVREDRLQDHETPVLPKMPVIGHGFGDPEPLHDDEAQGIAEGVGLVDVRQDLPRAALESLALEGCRARALTHAQVRRLLGFTPLTETDAFLKQHGAYLEYDDEALERDTENSRLANR